MGRHVTCALSGCGAASAHTTAIGGKVPVQKAMSDQKSSGSERERERLK